jgi:hypothetical protein
VGAIILCDDEATAGVFVEAVHNPRARNAADTAEFAFAVVKEGIDESVLFVAGGWMDDNSRRFVEDDEIGVLVNNVERYVLRLRFRRSGFGKVNVNALADAGSMRWLDAFAIDRDVALIDETLNGAARDGGKLGAQKRVEPLVGQRPFDHHRFSACRHGTILQEAIKRTKD